MKRTIQLFIIALLCVASAGRLTAQSDCSCINCPVPIYDNQTSQAEIMVALDGPNNLAECPLQQVCFEISHTWIGDLAVNLTSPNGTKYLVMADTANVLGGYGCGNNADNINVCVNVGTGNPLTNNENYTCNGPWWDCLTGDDWTVPCGGVTDPVTGALEAPNCDLNDFNTEGAPANGLWTLEVSDICLWNTGAIEVFTLQFACDFLCYDCEAEGGSINLPDVTACAGSDVLDISATPIWDNGAPSADYGYTFALVQDDIILTVTDTPDLTEAPAGEYQVYGISYHLFEEDNLAFLIGTSYSEFVAAPTFCADFSTDNGTVTILSEPTATVVNLEKCTDACVEYDGTEYCEEGTFPLVYQNSFGCDSLVNIIVSNFTQAADTEITLTACAGDCVEFDNNEYCIADTYELTYPDQNGCDSTVLLTVAFFEANTPGEENIQICQGECAQYNGTEYCNEGTFQVTLDNADSNGCDSLVNVNVSFYQGSTAGVENIQICQGECAQYNGTEYCNEGTFQITLDNADSNGCDSLVNVNVSFYQANTAGEENIQLCQGECAQYNGTEYCNEGTFQVILDNANSNGCDSLVNVNVSFYQANTAGEENIQVCQGECAQYNGTEYCTEGTFQVILDNSDSNGCDSLVNINVSFFETVEPAEVYLETCEDECLTYNNTEYCESGIFPVILQNANGCDSLVNLHISVFIPEINVAAPGIITCSNPTVTLSSTIEATVYEWTDAAGNLIGNTATVDVEEAGCYTLTITENNCQNSTNVCIEDLSTPASPAQLSGETTVCGGEQVIYSTPVDPAADTYVWTVPANAEVIGADNENTITIVWTNNEGGEICVEAQNDCGPGESDCLSVTVSAPAVSMSGETTICDSGTASINLAFAGAAPFTAVLNNETLENLPSEYNHEVFLSSTTVFSLTSVTDINGCTTTLNENITITVNQTPAVDLITETEVCNTNAAEDTHIVNFDDLFISNIVPGTWEDTDGSNAVGNFPSLDFYNVEPGSYTFTFISNNAVSPCEDVSASVEVIVAACTCPDGSFASAEICQSEALLDLNTLLNESQEGTWSITNQADNNTPASITGSNFNALNAATGFYTISFTLNNAPAGCPTTWENTIEVLPEFNTGESTQVEFCADAATSLDLFTLLENADADGVWTVASGSVDNAFNPATGIFQAQDINPSTYSFVYSQSPDFPCSNGSATVTVVIFPMPQADAGQEQTLTCDTPTAVLGGTGMSQGEGITYTWLSQDAFISDQPNPEITQAGTYTLTVTNANGCTSTDEIVVEEISSAPQAEVSLTPISCHEESDGMIEINSVAGGVEPYMFSLDGENFTDEMYFFDLGPATYTLTVQDANGCQSEISFDITQPQETDVVLVATLTEETDPPTITLGESIDLEALVNVPQEDITSVTWTNGELLDCDTCLAVTASPIETTTFTVTIEANACNPVTTSILVVVQRDYGVFVPDAFSPDGDGNNDTFYIFAPDNAVKVNNFMIYDRWGEALFQRKDFAPNDPFFGWDGTLKGQMMNNGVYVWYAEVEFIDGEVVVFKGDVTIMR